MRECVYHVRFSDGAVSECVLHASDVGDYRLLCVAI